MHQKIRFLNDGRHMGFRTRRLFFFQQPIYDLKGLIELLLVHEDEALSKSML